VSLNTPVHPAKSNRLVALLCKEVAGGFLFVSEHRRGLHSPAASRRS